MTSVCRTDAGCDQLKVRSGHAHIGHERWAKREASITKIAMSSKGRRYCSGDLDLSSFASMLETPSLVISVVRHR